MRVAVVAIGSTGDVLPYLGVARALAGAGITVVAATHGSYEPLVMSLGLDFHRLPMEPQAELDEERAAGMRRSPVQAAKVVQAVFEPWIRHLAFAIDEVTQETDLTLLSAMAWPGVHSALGRGIPSMGLHLQPLEPTMEFPPVALGARSLPGFLNRMLSRRAQLMMVEPYVDVVNEIRSRHGQSPISAADHVRLLRSVSYPILHGYSSRIAPRPRDWREGLDVVGYWWPATDPGWAPSLELQAFLDDGPRPVYIGFGSASPAEAEHLGGVVRSALSRARVRAVVSSGWTGLTVDHPDALVVDRIPHEWLLPRVSAVVHHAGAGTTGAALRAGVPSIPVPVALDQPFWASRLRHVGVATDPIPAGQLTADRLAAALVMATRDGGLRDRAAELGQHIRSEDGGRAVVEAVERHAR